MKTILITGSTDGIGLETAKKLISLGHNVIFHGRNIRKLNELKEKYKMDGFLADFSNLSDVKKFANEIFERYKTIDILINNAGVFKTKNTKSTDGYDVRYVVNTFAPYLLTKVLLPIINKDGRIINLSSAAQSSVDFDALNGKKDLNDFEAYAQSKLAITMWTRYFAKESLANGPVIIAVNPGSLLATKMVHDGFNTPGNDISIGTNILESLCFDLKHASKSGMYFDNDLGEYNMPLADGLDDIKTKTLINLIEDIVIAY